ncbi:MAG: transglutaminase family protein [Phycisphaerae bacterium]|nr:transglutaminase family protein [Phycisphaerae bacterium]
MELDTKHIRLDCASLHIARDVYPYIDIPAYLGRLDALADAIAARRPGLDSIQRYEVMREVLVDENNFVGVDGDFYDPENSYVNRVLDRGVGIPISLAVVWLEVARRLKWPVTGVNFPGRVLVRFDDPERLVIADPYDDGGSLSLTDCRKLLKEQLGQKAKLRAEHLAPIDTRAVLSRVLNNLRTIYMMRGEWSQLANILRRLAAVEPHNGQYLCELAGLHAHLGNMRSAYAHLAVYLERIPDGDQTALVRHSLQRLEAAISALN